MEVRRLIDSNVYYVNSHGSEADITLCIDPVPGSVTLGSNPLVPNSDDNYYTKIADASSDVLDKHVNVEILVSLDVEGVFLFNEVQPLSARGRTALKAILTVAQKKFAAQSGQGVDEHGRSRHKITVQDK